MPLVQLNVKHAAPTKVRKLTILEVRPWPFISATHGG
jgi:hypothetical protein